MLAGNPGFSAFVLVRMARHWWKVVPGTALAVTMLQPRHPVTAVGWLVYLVVLAGLIGLGWLYYTIEMWAREQVPFPLSWKILRIPVFPGFASLPLALWYWGVETGFYARNFV